MVHPVQGFYISFFEEVGIHVENFESVISLAVDSTSFLTPSRHAAEAQSNRSNGYQPAEIAGYITDTPETKGNA